MSFLRNSWYVAGFPEDLAGGPIAKTFLNEPMLLYRTDGGQAVALDNRCPHRFAPLSKGKVFGDTIECSYHGLRFDPTGSCVLTPSGDAPPPRAAVRSYPVVERHRLLWIWMGDPARADPGTIPDCRYLEDARFGWFNLYLHARANYQLLVDNLLDLTHGEFLHPALSSEDFTARNEQVIRQHADRITIDNIAEGDNIIPIMRQMRPDMEVVGTTRQEEQWDAPSLVRLSIEYYAAGEQIIIPSGHFLTPETSRSTHYFNRSGQDVHPEDAAYTANMREGVKAIFRDEDVPLIEAQQEHLGTADLLDLHPAILKADGGAIRARRHLAKLIRQEQSQMA